MLVHKVKKKRICFACFTPGNIFISYILAKTVYKDDYKILILSDWNCTDVYFRIVENSSVWDKVILINEAGRKNRNQRFKEIRDQLRKINFDRIDVLHYIQMNQNSYLHILFNYIPDKTKIIATIFCKVTYYIKEHYLYASEILRNNNIDCNIDLDRVSEIWVYDKKLYIDKLFKRPVKNIEIFKYIKNKKMLNRFCNELNKIFNYRHKLMDYDVIFCDQPLKRGYFNNEMQKEKQLFSKIINEFKNYKVLVKNHHRSPYEKYKEFEVGIIEENKGHVPWELILLNELNNNESNASNKIFVSYFSETVFTTNLFLNNLNIPHKTIRLKGILENHINRKIGNDMDDKFDEKFKELYGENLYDIESIDELRNTLAKFR
ncbi:hypothetical protein IZY60_11515 [Lutibacter sp. B2]|nr:hypothetical protein [Lutibacter sp. B2]